VGEVVIVWCNESSIIESWETDLILPVCDLSSSQAGHGLLQVLPQVCDIFDSTQPSGLRVFT